ncbi:hypothetical protein SAMN05216571_101417 [Onishia taeanensis]|uniref:Uncharacterized protein n=1 Tax=Onishia taeanensis TaxID=284577 RepID=A0A1G7NHV4_9GAMM|nr:hypothetical protein [Halomonas taeanensis]SDF72879.1 hypothetical protein SAMN05216571_101417 [Halomonas taeanensis]
MAKQFKTTFVIDGDSRGAVAAQRDARQETEALSREMALAEQRGQEMAASFETVKSRAAGFATVVGASAVSLGAISTAQIQATQQAGIMADALGMSVQRLQELQYAAKQKGIDDIGDTLKDVSDKIGDAFANGGGEAMDALDNLNLSAERLIELRPDEQLLAIAQGLKDLPKGEQVNVMESLGNDAIKLLPLLEDNGRLLEQLAVQAHDAGVALSDVDNQTLLAAGDALGEMQGYAEGLANQLALKVAPSITETTERVGELVDDLGGMESVATGLINTAGGLAAVMGTRLAVSLASATAEAAKKIAADIAAARAELRVTQQTARRAAAELQTARTLQARAVADAKALAGTNAHALAMDNLARASARTTAAQAANTQAANAQAAAMKRASGMARGLSGAMALVGGPAGAAILAAGALYTYREELGLVSKEAVITTQRIDSLTDAINLNNKSAVEAGIVQLSAEYFQLGQDAAAAQARIDELTAAQQNDTRGARQNLQNMMRLEDAENSLKRIQAEQKAAGEGADELREVLASVGDQTVKTADSTRTLAKESDEQTTAFSDQANAARSLVDELYPLQAAQREYADDKAALIQYALREDKSNEWLAESMRRLERQYSNAGSAAETYGLEAARAAEGTETAFDATVVAMERGVERMDDAFVDSWRSLLDGSENAFDAFKNIALDTLAEVIHAYTTRQITASLGASFSGGATGGMGMGSQGGGYGSLLSTGKQLYNGFSSGFGNVAWTGASNTAYAGGWAGSATGGVGQSGLWGGSTSNFSGMQGVYSAGAGYIGGKAGQAVWGSDRANSNYGQMAGTAIGTYFGGPIGAGIGSFLGSGVDQLFGSGRSSYGQIGQELNAKVDAHGVYRYDRLDKYQNYARDSAFGTIGITKKQKTDDAALKKMVKQFVEIDNAVAAVMTASQLKHTQKALDGWKSSKTGDIGSIVGQRLNAVAGAAGTPFTRSLRRLSGEDLVQGIIGGLQIENVGAEMARAVARDMNAEFRDALRSGDDISAATQSILTAANAVSLMADSAERLGLEFDATVTGALAAADDLQELAGGVSNLSSQQQAYYQAFFSDQEKFAYLADNLADRFDDLNLAMPDTASGFRDLVEAQNLMSEAGREQYAVLMQLVPSMSQYLDVMDRQHSQLQSWIDSLLLSDQSTLDPSERLQESQTQYASLLVQAENGDAQAMGDLGNVAQQYLREAASYYGQASGQYGSLFDEILDAARGLGVEVDGSHANGLASVPFDGYRAELHQGETVLPAPIAQLYRDSAPGGGQRDADLLRELQALRRESEALRDEVRQLRGDSARNADRAAAQRDRQLREQQGIHRNTRTPVTTV